MFPFKTKQFSFLINTSPSELRERLACYSKKFSFVSLSKKENFGIVDGGKMDFELSEIPSRNSFRPVIIFRWDRKAEQTLITGYYRLPKGITFLSAFLLFPGLVYAYKVHNFFPVLFFVICSLAFLLLGYLLFRKEYDWVRTNFEDMLSGELPLQRYIL